MDQRVSLITIAVADLDRSAAFYTELGWQEVDRTPQLVVYDLLCQSFGLYEKSAMEVELGLGSGSIKGFSGVTLAQNQRSPDEVDALMARARSVGARVLKAPQKVFWGGYHGYFADPDGHIWEIAHNPFSALGPNGAFQWRGAE